MKMQMMEEANVLVRALKNLKREKSRIKRWQDGRLYIESETTEIHGEFKAAVKALILTSVVATLKGVEDQLRAIGIDPDEGEG